VTFTIFSVCVVGMQASYGFDVNVTYEELVDVTLDENDQQVPNPKLASKLKSIGFTLSQVRSSDRETPERT
jgi:hypothetical protein